MPSPDNPFPLAAVWSAASFLLAVACFVQFARPFAARNRDILGLYLFVPGFLHLITAHLLARRGSEDDLVSRDLHRSLAYSWLIAASVLWFIRCFIDHVMTRRPNFPPNLTTGGIVWLGSAMLATHLGLAALRTNDPLTPPTGKRPAAVAGVESGAAAIVAATGQNTFDTQAVVTACFSAVGHMGIVAGLWTIGAVHFRNRTTGLAMAFCYLLVPYTGFQFSSFHIVMPAALILAAVACYRSVTWAGVLLGFAAGTAYFPLLLLPAWLQFYRSRRLGRFAVFFGTGLVAGAGVALLGLWLLGQSPTNVWRNANFADWLPWRVPESESLWMRVHWAYRLPVFVVYAAFVLTSIVWPACRNLGQLIAVSAAILIGVQFWFADQGGIYVLWYLPLAILMAFRPVTTEMVPPAPGDAPRGTA
jgi:hypothetical protein